MQDDREFGEVPPTKEQEPGAENAGPGTSHSASLVGEVLDGRFQIEKDLSDSEGADKGGIGLIYIAKDLKLLGKQVVVKILKADSLENPDILRKFLHEKEALIRLEHPNIVRILDSGTLSDGNPFIVMEFIPGISLRKVLRERGRLPLEFVAHVVESVAEALGAAHAQKILHRDIKPENIMLTPRGHGFEHVRVIDFGVARVEESQLAPMTEVVRGIGTVLYMAPEQLVGTIKQTQAVDVYSLAIVAYEMLTSRRPFEPQSTVEMYVLQKEGLQDLPTSLREDVPAEADDLLLEALEFEPGKRPQDVREFGRHVAEALRSAGSDQDAIPTLRPHLAPTEAFEPVKADVTTMEAMGGPNAALAPETVDSSPEPTKASTSGIPFKLVAGAIAALILILVVSVPALYFLWPFVPDNSNAAANTAVPAPARGLKEDSGGSPDTIDQTSTETEEPAGTARAITYFLDIQRMENEEPSGPAFRSGGAEVFRNGDKFRFNFVSDASGFLYVFSDDADERGRDVFNILYPTPSTNGGSAQTNSGSAIQSSWNNFSGQGGTETVWVLWTAQRREELESARGTAFDNMGKVTGRQEAGALRSFIDDHKSPAPVVERSGDGGSNELKARGDIVVHRLELQHW